MIFHNRWRERLTRACEIAFATVSTSGTLALAGGY